jgi:dienelactone hydrolase
MTRLLIAVTLLLTCAGSGWAAIQGKEVEYHANGTVLKGFLAFDDAVSGPRPAVLVVHEWWGLDEYARSRARMLAELGYTALAVDMYGEGKQASHPEDAKKFSGELRKNLPLAQKRVQAAIDFLQKQPTVTKNQLAGIGYCFGGGILLEMARAGLPMNGVVSVHGTLASERPAKSGDIRTSILVLNGAADPFVPAEDIAKFNREMATAGIDYQFVNYAGAKHSFSNPQADENGKKFNMPLAYSPEADRRSWQQIQLFLKEVFATK